MSITRAVTPLRMVFWGGILCVFDLTFSSTTSVGGQPRSGFRFDLLNDFAGMLLITVGVFRLSEFAVDAAFRSAMRFVFVCCVLNCPVAFMEHFVFPSPAPLSGLLHLLGLASLGATVVFCSSMHRLSVAFALHQSASSWLTTLCRFVRIAFPSAIRWIITARIATLMKRSTP